MNKTPSYYLACLREKHPLIMIQPFMVLSPHEKIVFSGVGQAHDQLDHFFENSMRDLQRREIEIEGIVLLSQRRLMAMGKETFLAGEADQKRVDLLASQRKKSELLLGHELEAKRQRKGRGGQNRGIVCGRVGEQGEVAQDAAAAGDA